MTSTVLFPQRQGAGANGRPIAAGARSLAARLGGTDHVVLVDDSFSAHRDHGIVAREQLVAQLRTARAVLSGVDRFLLIGGDCSADLVGIGRSAELHGSELAVVYVDAHADSNIPTSSPSGALHGMVVRHAVGDGDAELTEIAAAAIDPARLLHVGVRDEDPPESEWCLIEGVARIPVPTDVAACVEHPVVRSAGTLHLHLDLDVLDPAEFPWTTYPTPDGPSVAMIARLVDELSGTDRLGSIALTESIANDEDQLDAIDPILRAIDRWRIRGPRQP